MHRAADIVSAGEVIFKSETQKATASAKFAVLKEGTPTEHLVQLLRERWRLERPSVLLSVSGSAQDMKLEQSLEHTIKAGLESAARSTNAWVFTGGMDAGVMALTSNALRGVASDSTSHDQLQTPCIGVAPFRKVRDSWI